jgi:serine/threonine protein kinase/Flp pilus assembly protein TadD
MRQTEDGCAGLNGLSQDSEERSGDDPRLARAMEEYQALLAAGQKPDHDSFLARYPEVAGALADGLAGLDFLHAAAPNLSAPVTDSVRVAGPDAGTPLGDFRLIREVGSGGMGVVYEAEQISLRRRVALKVLPFAATMDPRQLQRFQNEARAAACLHHTNIVPVYGVGCERGVHFYAMQFIEGQSLAALLDQQRGGGSASTDQPTTAYATPAPAAETAVQAAAATVRAPRDAGYFRRVAEWGVQAAEALDCAHAVGIVHRDIKPANLMIDTSGRLWVTDFGLAQMQNETRLTATGDLVGTLRYMSPEQALAKRVLVDHRSDIYSLGATLYELLTLQPPVTGEDRQELLRQIAFEEPPRPRRLDRRSPAELETIVLKAMEKNPKDRYATAQELADDLERFVKDEPIRARRPSLGQRARKWARRHRAGVTAAALCLLAILLTVVGSVGWVLGDRTARQAEAGGKVQEALQAAEPGLQQGNPWDPALISALRRAEAQLESGLLNPALRRQVEQLQKDVQMLADLERIRLSWAKVRDNHFDRTGSELQFAKAFTDYGIDLETLTSAAAAALVQVSAVRMHLVAGLDDWIDVLTSTHKEETTQKVRHLVAVTRQADPDPWRNRMREIMLSRDAGQLEHLVRSAPVEKLPAPTLGLLGTWLLSESLPFGLRDKALQSGVEILRRAQRRYPGDFWINQSLAKALAPSRLEEAIGFYRTAVALRPLSPGAHLNLGNALRDKGDLEGAIAPAREAIRLKQDYAEAHSNLGNALTDRGDLAGAIAEFREAIRLKEDYAQAYYNLGAALWKKKDLDGAIGAYREAIQLRKQYPEAYTNLGLALRAKKDQDGAIDAFRKALRLKNDFPEAHIAHSNLGLALFDKGDLEGAIDQFREAIRHKQDWTEAHIAHFSLGVALHRRGNVDGAIAAWREAILLKKDYADAHNNLGAALHHKGLLDEAITEFRLTIRLKKDDADAHNNLGNALKDKGLFDEAIAEYREAICLKKNHPHAHYNLGNVLQGKGQLDEAIAEYREAIRLNKDYPEAHCNLGHVLCNKGQFAEALTHLRRGHQLGSKNSRWRYPSAQWVQQCERLVELDGKLPAILRGKAQPADAAERLEYGGLCQTKRLYAAAARFYADAFAQQSQLADDLNAPLRYNAACAAALAGCGQGKDTAQTDAKQRSRLRRQALDWLRADLDAYRRLLEKAPDKAAPPVRERMQHWLQDKDFTGVRSPDALAKLPEAEHQQWQKLWADVAEILARTGNKAPPEKKSATK